MRVCVCVCFGNSYKVALLFACFVVCRQCSPCKNVGRYFLSAEQRVEQQQERQQLGGTTAITCIQGAHIAETMLSILRQAKTKSICGRQHHQALHT